MLREQAGPCNNFRSIGNTFRVQRLERGAGTKTQRWGSANESRTLIRSISVPRSSWRRKPQLEEQERHCEYEEKRSKVSERECPSAAVIDAIYNCALTLLVQCPHHQVDHNGCTHGHKADKQESVYEREIRDAGHMITHDDLVSNAGQNPDERDIEPVAQR